MKRRFVSLFTLCILLFATAFSFAACGEKKENVEDVVIRIEEPVVEGTTLLDIMEDLQTEGKLTFTVSDGMITEINGVKNTVTYNPCWMLYTSDANNSNTAWGTYDYEGVTLGSATVGAGELMVSEGETYVWTYQSF